VLNLVATKDEITASHITVSFISWAIAQAFMIFSSLEDKALEWAYTYCFLQDQGYRTVFGGIPQSENALGPCSFRID